MQKKKSTISLVWLKRDLRLEDNEAIFNALSSEKQVLFLYVFEELLMNDPHYSQRHWNFIKESLSDLYLSNILNLGCSLVYFLSVSIISSLFLQPF